jgi:polygalacturonase
MRISVSGLDSDMVASRRFFVASGIGIGLAGTAVRAEAKAAGVSSLVANTGLDQTANLQAAIDEAAARGVPLEVPAGVFKTGPLDG